MSPDETTLAGLEEVSHEFGGIIEDSMGPFHGLEKVMHYQLQSTKGIDMTQQVRTGMEYHCHEINVHKKG